MSSVFCTITRKREVEEESKSTIQIPEEKAPTEVEFVFVDSAKPSSAPSLPVFVNGIVQLFRLLELLDNFHRLLGWYRVEAPIPRDYTRIRWKSVSILVTSLLRRCNDLCYREVSADLAI